MNAFVNFNKRVKLQMTTIKIFKGIKFVTYFLKYQNKFNLNVN